ncbi:MAG: DUF4214 domain-containing protein, partial [Pseudomonadota bacterium]
MTSDEEFLAFAYRRVLGRSPRGDEVETSLNRLRSKLASRDTLLMELLTSHAERSSRLPSSAHAPSITFA